MKPKNTILTTLAICAALFVVGLAQQSYQPSCAITLKTDPDKFMESYAEKNNNQSEAGYDEAAMYWGDCKFKENQSRLAKFPSLRSKLQNMYRNYNDFFSAETELAYAAAGGGTMFPHGRARFQPSLEIHFGKLIDLLSSKAGAAKNAAITARYNKAKATLETRLKKVQTKPNPFTDGYSKTEIAEKNRQWLEVAKNYATLYANIRKNLGSSIDLTSTTMLEFLATGLWAGEL